MLPCRLFSGLVLMSFTAAAAAADAPTTKQERFDRDPGWEERGNRIVPPNAPVVQQNFGYSPTQHAGRGRGEIGGRVHRANRPAFYAMDIGTKTLRDRLRASGVFALTKSEPAGGAYFGWFNSQQPGSSGRPIQSLGLDFGTEHAGGRLAVRLINAQNKSTGMPVTSLEHKFKPTSLRNDGTRYRWTLDYDPDANDGRGRFTFTIMSDARQHEAFEGKLLTADLPPGFKEEGATFDRFGLMNALKGGGAMEIYFDDLELDGRTEDFTRDPQWSGVGNRERYADRERPGMHDFGYSPATQHAGGAAPGEIGGDFWRTGKDWSYYADRVGPFTLEQRFEARGKVMFAVGGPDSAMCFGFFNHARRGTAPPDHAGDFVGIRVGGPTRIGHYFLPAYATSKGTTGKVDRGPILTPGKIYAWSLVYDPAANHGNGEIAVTLGNESVVLPLKPGRKAEGAQLDRFGLFSTHPGGQMVRIFFDDLTYSAAP